MSRGIKCLVWDLDHTLWDGVLLEEGAVRLRPEAAELIRTLDERGILHSVASKNDPAAAGRQIEAFGLADYFLCPQITWNPKSNSVADVARSLNIGLDAVAFIDDQSFEREEVAFAHPQVLCLDAAEVGELAHRPEFTPRFVTDDSRNRRHMYRGAQSRTEAEQEFVGTSEEFLATLGMEFTISEARESDLRRAEELTIRTNQLNSTGITYSYDELARYAQSPDHLLLVAGLDDRFGSYGKIGLALVERGTGMWTIKLLLMSCRVMSRGVGTVLLNHLMRLAADAGVRLRAEFLPNDRNRVMQVTYGFAGFKEVGRSGDTLLLEGELNRAQEPPGHLTVTVG
ncbi:HAD-IIIC family phosphatase [Nonomuraea sp. NBC_01738]|uniref:HAD-IIIC family phosphatase n=1 Tax=Nonomuraea sp. NBC_01738 TaxID=2976003 RepID=UPI002E14B771|nr:HAD-IIIC family phosphatase [Nonomuraea sp. NBC_01738]